MAAEYGVPGSVNAASDLDSSAAIAIIVRSLRACVDGSLR